MFNFFLWPFIIPIILPLFYSFIHKKESFLDILLIAFTMLIILIFYWPLTQYISSPANIINKFLLFIVIPLIIISIKIKNDKKNISDFKIFGVTLNNIKKSVALGFIYIPIMLFVTFIIKYFTGFSSSNPDVFFGIISFFESFSEEFFFRGILFLYLYKKTSFYIAYVTSLSSFILIHPQYISDLFLITTIVQGILTIEICRRTKNLTGSWILHGTNRFFSIVILLYFF